MRSHGRTGQRHVRCGFALALPLAIIAVQAEAQTRAYVTSTTANLVTVIDTSTRAVVGTIEVGTMPTHLAIAADGTRVYVTNTGSSSISVIDTATDAVAATIPLAAAPYKAAVTPSGRWLYVTAADGAVHVIDTALNADVTSIPIGALEGGDIAVSPDGSRAYVAAGLVSVIDTGSHTLLEAFAAEKTPTPLVATFAVAVAFAPDGARAYIGTVSYDSRNGDFSAGGGIAVVDAASRSVTSEINLYSQPGSIAVTPDGARLYVGHLSTWVDTGYGAGFLNGHAVNAIDAATKAWVASAELGYAAAIWDGQNTAAGLAVTPDRSGIFVAIPRLDAVAEIDPSTNEVKQTIAVAAGPGALAIVPDPSAGLKGFTIEAVNDAPSAAVAALAGGAAVKSVLSNDTLGGAPAALVNVTLSLVSSSHPGVTLDGATGAVLVDETTAVGSYELVYQICETSVPANCNQATVTVDVRDPYIIHAENDRATSHAGTTAIASVLANDTLGGGVALAEQVTLAVGSSSDAAIGLDLASGAVFLVAGAAAGEHALVYRICETASARNCAEATATVTVVPYAIAAAGDRGTAARTGGIAVTSVLANDTFDGLPAAQASVTLSQISSSNAGVTLNTADGSVSVARGTTAGTHDLVYRICEAASPDNCSQASVSVTVNPYVIYAGSDRAKASSKQAGTALPNVLTNDTLGGMPATLANVKLSLVSVSPARSKVTLDVADGSVDVTGKTDSGLVTLTYQICEIESAANCTRGTVSVDLSGK
jgi:YVTN family beta-propeller protein